MDILIKKDSLVFPPGKKYFQAANRLKSWLKACVICPRACQVNRLENETGFCGITDKAIVNTYQLHFGEEPAISGSQGSGTVFFSGCTLACRFCQNHEISQSPMGTVLTARELSQIFLDLQSKGAHNINLVTPTPHLPMIMEALGVAREKGLNLPIVYNTSLYERPGVIKQLEGLIEIYLPDFKYFSDVTAHRLSLAENYVKNATESLIEMIRQVGNLQVDSKGVAQKGVLVRHLVLPNGLSQTPLVLAELKRIAGDGLWISLMSQYRPMYMASQTKGLERSLYLEEYQEAIDACDKLEIINGYIQGLESIQAQYFPKFNNH